MLLEEPAHCQPQRKADERGQQPDASQNGGRAVDTADSVAEGLEDRHWSTVIGRILHRHERDGHERLFGSALQAAANLSAFERMRVVAELPEAREQIASAGARCARELCGMKLRQ